MKILIVIAVSLFLVGVGAEMTPEVKAKLKKYMEQCKAATEVSQETIDKARKGEMDETDKQLGEFILCYSLKNEGIKMQPIINDKRIMKFMDVQNIPKADGEKALEECKKMEDADPRLWAIKFVKCLKTKVRFGYD